MEILTLQQQKISFVTQIILKASCKLINIVSVADFCYNGLSVCVSVCLFPCTMSDCESVIMMVGVTRHHCVCTKA